MNEKNGISAVKYILLTSLAGQRGNNGMTECHHVRATEAYLLSRGRAGKGVGLLLLLLLLLLLFPSCSSDKHTPSVMFGQAEVENAAAYDLADIQAAGELIAVTLSGPDTYYEYRGRGFGLEFDMAEAFARSIGTRLRMEMASDTAELLRRLEAGEADLIAFPFKTTMYPIPSSLQEVSSHPLTAENEGNSDIQPTLPQKEQEGVTDGPHWLVRSTSPELAEAISRWWQPGTRERFLAAEQARRQDARRAPVSRLVRPPMLSRASGVISSYDHLFIRHATTASMDWRLLAAQCYQESAFTPRAVSWAGAQGLMQIMPGTATHLGLAPAEVFEPEKNIAAAARYLRELNATFADIPHPSERIRFVLAAYNGGVGHVRDAMALANKHGGDAHRWADVNPYILRLSDPRYYRDPVVKNGYLRGTETAGYVQQILERWNYYRGNAHPASVSPAHQPSRNNPSRIRPRSDFELSPDTVN